MARAHWSTWRTGRSRTRWRLATSSGRSVLKIRPPLVISNSEIELLVERLAAVLARAIGLTATGTWVDTPTVTGSLPGHVAAGPLHRRLILPVLDDLGWRRARADPDDVDAPGPAGLVSGEQVRDPLRVQSVACSLVRTSSPRPSPTNERSGRDGFAASLVTSRVHDGSPAGSSTRERTFS